MNKRAGYNYTRDISIVLAGEAGQGIQTIEVVLTRLFKQAGFHVFATKEYMSRVRGGTNSTEIRVAAEPVACFVNRIDICIPLDAKAITHLEKRFSDDTLIIGDVAALGIERKIVDVPFREIGTKLGSAIFSNIVAAGFLSGMLGIEVETVYKSLACVFAGKGDDLIEKNCQAAAEGWERGKQYAAEQKVRCSLTRDTSVAQELILNGHQAVGLGALAGGCTFVSSYPMSPSTGVLVFLAGKAREFGIIVEQAEDEISAINMALGSWFAGGRALVTTSGGGFALMAEGLSLAGCIESPAVIHCAQRPGPATGLPTRTEQGDLDFVLSAGHGEFPRVVLTPGTVQDAFFCAYKAFEIADAAQVPVIILTDQYLLDSYYTLSQFPAVPPIGKNHIVKTTKDYRRYHLTENGISPRGIPGFGEGYVCVDSDEHDERGWITEDFDVRVAMVDKRLKKREWIAHNSLEPELFGAENYKRLIVGWGSTAHVVREALAETQDAETAFLYLKQVYPLPEKVSAAIRQAKETVVVENNATGQLAHLIRRESGLSVGRTILKYNGLPFSVEEIKEQL